ncbi:MAG TPA: caspase family protein [Hyphomicrobiaceae bacterium]|nr:caspase family protein [Hyphomicrobiaceae bacterium]
MAHSLRARHYAIEGKYELALRDNIQAVQLNPSDPNGYASRCLTYVRKGEFDLAITDCSHAIELKPNYAFAFAARGAAYYYKRDYDRAIKDATKAIAFDPKLAAAYHMRGRAYAELGQLDRALAEIDRAIAIDPKSGLAHNGRALVLVKKGDDRRALEEYSRAVALAPREAESYANRAELYVKLGDQQKAIEDARTVLALPATSPFAREAQIKAAEMITRVAVQPARVPVSTPLVSPDRGKRVALLIGNSRYAGASPLRNPANDAHAIAVSLRSVGFSEVMEKYDLSLAEMSKILKEFGDHAQGADWAVIYFAGHGLEMNGTAYLVPVDAQLERDTHVADETIAVDRMLEKVDGARRLKLVILDACRNNPFVSRMVRSGSAARSIGRGLPALEPEGDVMVAYSTKHGTTALDGDGENSPYATALVQQIPVPNVDIRVMFGRVRDTVRKLTHNQQEPYTYGSIGGDLHFIAVNK